MSHDDVMPEDGEAPAAATPDLETTLETRTPEEWAEALANAEQKAQENWDKVLRTQADLENIKRRSEKDLQNAHKFGIEKLRTNTTELLQGKKGG
ncbi:MAG: nucleotide exchange factor GrpE, partial [Gammaproteobacteria bacterium]|nr:nucleotide exchange factor GrpE [Gammaproteobacteria bacterium]NDG88390.1 nucleotide exchange factor GrpE [Gammaproteobacteria bacterium]